MIIEVKKHREKLRTLQDEENETMSKECLVHGESCLVCSVALELEISHLSAERDKEKERADFNLGQFNKLYKKVRELDRVDRVEMNRLNNLVRAMEKECGTLQLVEQMGDARIQELNDKLQAAESRLAEAERDSK